MWAQIWAALVGAWHWLCKHPIALAGALGALVGAVLMVRSKQNQIGTLKDAFEVQRIKASVAHDEAQAELLTEQAGVHAAEAEALQLKLTQSKRRAVELASAKPLDQSATDAEIAKLFTDAGF